MPPVVLRPHELSDVPAIHAGIVESRSELAPWMPWCTPEFDEEGVRAWVERARNDREGGFAFAFGIFAKDGEFLGNCALNAVHRVDGFANLGYWIRTSKTGRGVATSAVLELVRWGFAETTLQRFEIVVALENVASQRVAERAGAVREGILRRRLLLAGRPHDAVLYAIVRPGA
jgi:ribosomal-protein-serine acetyltransferase